MSRILMFFLILGSFNTFGQEHRTSIDAIIDQMLDHINRRPGEKLNEEEFRSLFDPAVKFMVLYHDDESEIPAETVNLDEFIEYLNEPYYEEGFTEYGTGKKIDEYNGIAQVFQSFYAKDAEGEEGRGITSYQLVYHSERWWITSVLWTTDDNGMEVPEKYIKE